MIRARNWKPSSHRLGPPEILSEAKGYAKENGETLTDVLNDALSEYVRRERRKRRAS